MSIARTRPAGRLDRRDPRGLHRSCTAIAGSPRAPGATLPESTQSSGASVLSSTLPPSLALAPFLLLGCSSSSFPSSPPPLSSSSPAPPPAPPEPSPVPSVANDLPTRHRPDPAQAARGAALFTETPLVSPPPAPMIGLRNLWLVWDAPPTRHRSRLLARVPRALRHDRRSLRQRWLPARPARRRRAYGMLDCYTCHAGRGRGRGGARRRQLHLRHGKGSTAIIAALANASAASKLAASRSSTARGLVGANDAWGLGVRLAAQYGGTAPTCRRGFYGYQRPDGVVDAQAQGPDVQRRGRPERRPPRR